jgi:flavin-dependent dehydrogenase
MSGPSYDVAIAGGGPAGCSAAIRLAQRGASVVLCEARTYPHDKVCGEFLSSECSVLLAWLGLDGLLATLGAVPIGTASLAAPNGVTWETHFPAPAWGLSRHALDAALAEHARAAGVDVRTNTSVLDISGSLGEAFRLGLRCGGKDGSLRARAVIAAHGKRSSLDRALGRRFLTRREPYVALKTHFHGPRLPGRIELNVFPGGYCGLSEIENGTANLGLLVRESVFQAVGGAGPGAIDNFVAWLRRQNPRLDAWLGQAARLQERWLSIAQIPFSPKEAVVGDVLLAGDAAGVIAPLAGDGIAMALRSGGLVADLVLRYLDGNLPAAELRQNYAARWAHEFGPRLRLGRVLQPLLMQPRVAGLGLRLLRLAPGMGRALVHSTRDLDPLEKTELEFAETNP